MSSDHFRQPQINTGKRSVGWSDLFLSMAYVVAMKSKDRTGVGCVVVDSQHRVLSVGFNGFPRGVQDHSERYLDRPVKLSLIVHAEENAICAAAHRGISLNGSRLYCTHPPCGVCFKSIIQAGISEVVWPACNPFDCDPEKLEWRTSHTGVDLMASEAGVKLTRYEGSIGGVHLI